MPHRLCTHTHAPFDEDDAQTASLHYQTATNQPTPLPGAFYHDPLGTWLTFIDEYAPDGYGSPPPNTPYYAPLGTPPGTPLSPLQTPTLAPTRTPHRDLRIAPLYNYPLPHPWLNPHEQRQQLLQAGYDPDAPHIAQAHIDYEDHQRPLWYTIQRTWAHADGTVPNTVTLTSSATRWQPHATTADHTWPTQPTSENTADPQTTQAANTPTTTTTTTPSTAHHTDQHQRTQQSTPGSSTDQRTPPHPTPDAEPAAAPQPTPPTQAEHQPQARQPQEYSNTTHERTSLYTTPQQPTAYKQPPNTPPSKAHTTPPATIYKAPPTPATAAPEPHYAYKTGPPTPTPPPWQPSPDQFRPPPQQQHTSTPTSKAPPNDPPSQPPKQQTYTYSHTQAHRSHWHPAADEAKGKATTTGHTTTQGQTTTT